MCKLFCFLCGHILGSENSAADALSRFQISRFCHLIPSAAALPTPVRNLILCSMVPPNECPVAINSWLMVSPTPPGVSLSVGFNLFPVSEWTLMLFITWLFSVCRLASSSIRLYLSAVRSLHIDAGLPDPLVCTPPSSSSSSWASVFSF